MASKTEHSSYLGLPMEIRHKKNLHFIITGEDLEDDTDLVCKLEETTYQRPKLIVFHGSTTMF